jgi:DnaA family protein
MTQQLPLSLWLQHLPSLDDFIVGQNQVVIDALQRSLEGGGEAILYLFGPAGCGRSHLLQGQCALAEKHGLQCAYLGLSDRATLSPQMLEGLETLDLIAVDDVQLIAGDRVWEAALFALFNRCHDLGTRMIFSADCGPASLPIRLPDLRSRLAWGLSLSLRPLDDKGRLELLQSLAARRALKLPDDVARYLLERTPRHPSDLVATIARLDQASLAEKRRLTIPFVRDSLHLG